MMGPGAMIGHFDYCCYLVVGIAIYTFPLIMMMITMSTGEVDCTCSKCGYQWTPRVPRPVECPNCKNRNWNQQ